MLYRIRLRREDMVLRLFLPERWPSPPSALAERESAILSALTGSDLPVPAPIGCLPGNGLVMTFLPGEVALPAAPTGGWLDVMAQMLSRIHASGVNVPYRYRSWNGQRGTSAPDWWGDPALWSAALDATANLPERDTVFLHRDYHPVNLLWTDGHVTGVVDWINACMGPRGVDVAHCRLNLALMYGQVAAEGFLDAYTHHAPGYEHDPRWDVDDALGMGREPTPYPPWSDFGLTDLTTAAVRYRLEAFVQAALDG